MDFLYYISLLSICPSLGCGLAAAGILFPTAPVWLILLASIGFGFVFMLVLVPFFSAILWWFYR